MVLLLPCCDLIPLARRGRRVVRNGAPDVYRKHMLPSGTMRVSWCALCSVTVRTSSQAIGEKTLAPCGFH